MHCSADFGDVTFRKREGELEINKMKYFKSLQIHASARLKFSIWIKSSTYEIAIILKKYLFCVFF
jgi:hypothetical protein